MSDATCPICDREFTSTTAGSDHAWDAHGACHYCGDGFDDREALYTHWLDDHEGDLSDENRKRAETKVGDRTVCPACGERFASDAAVRDHSWDAHGACFLCGETFAAEAALYTHWLAVHDEELPREDRKRAASEVGPLTFGNRLAHQGPIGALKGVRVSRRALLGGSAVAVGAGLGGAALTGLFGSSGGSATASKAAAGNPAPPAPFTTVSGESRQLAEFRGQKVMLWLFATWCPSCKRGARALQNNNDRLQNMKVLGLQTAGNAGYNGPSVQEFVRSFSPSLLTAENWVWGTASEGATQTYNPKDRPDIYYLINADGTIRAVNTAPAATLDRIVRFAGTQ